MKSVHVLGVGIRVDDVQLPSSELLPAIEGSVSELVCSRLEQPADARAITESVTSMRMFISIFR